MPVSLIYLTSMIKGSILVALILFFMAVFYFIGLLTLKLVGYTSLARAYRGSIWFLPHLSTRSFIGLFVMGIGSLKFVDHG
jgi:hypothetical protein